jgi:YVTN family beta-propeller protein
MDFDCIVRFTRLSLAVVSALLVAACEGGVAAVVAIAIALGSGGGAAPVVPLVLFPGDEGNKPAVVLPFTAEVQAIAVTPDGSKLYTADALHNTVSVMDTELRRVIKIIDVTTGPRFLTIDPSRPRLYVANYGLKQIGQEGANNVVTVIDTGSDHIIATVEVGLRPYAMTLNENGDKLYVLNRGDGFDVSDPADTVSVIDLTDLNQPARTVDLILGVEKGVTPSAIVVAPSTERAFITNRNSDNVAVIDTSTDSLVSFIDVGEEPLGIVAHPEGSQVFVTSSRSNTVSVIDTASLSVTKTITVGLGPMAIAIDFDAQHLYVANASGPLVDDACAQSQTDTVSVIDIEQLEVVGGEITVGPAPLAVAITGDGEKAYTMSACEDDATGESEVSVIDESDIGTAATASRSIPTTGRGTAMIMEPDSERLLVAQPDSVTFIDVATDTVDGAPIAVRGFGPTKLKFAAGGSKLYAIRPGSDTVVVIDVDRGTDTEQVLGAIAVGHRPSDLAVTEGRASGDLVLVTNAGVSRQPGHSISFIDVTPAGQLDQSVDTLEPLDGNSEPLMLGPVAVAVTGDQQSAIVANFGDFFPNTRVPGERISIVDLDTRGFTSSQFFSGLWPIDVIADPDVDDGFLVAAPRIDQGGRVLIGSVSNAQLDEKFSELIDVPVDLEPSPVASFSGTPIFGGNYNSVNNSGGLKPVAFQVLDPNFAEADCNDVDPACPKPNLGKIAVTPDGNRLFALHAGDRSRFCGAVGDNEFCEIGTSVTVYEAPFNPPAGQVVTVGRRPTDVAFADDTAIVANYFDNTASVFPFNFSLGTTPIVNVVDVGIAPAGIAAHPDEQRVYVANSISNDISVIDTASGDVIRTLQLPW